jgi:hypothetical protein
MKSDACDLIDQLKGGAAGKVVAAGIANAKSEDTNNAVPEVASAGGATILRHPAAPEALPVSQYLDPSFDLDTVTIPFVRFPGVKNVLPDCEGSVVGYQAFVREIAPDPAPVVISKDAVPYFIAGTLKDAELKNKRLREARLAARQSTIGRQRSSAHIATLGPAILFDDDGDVFARLPALRALGAASVIYSSYSFGFPKGDQAEPRRGGRVGLFLNRSVTPAEYPWVWDAINHLFGGGFDEHGRSPALCYGRHARRSAVAPYNRLVLEGAALDADALLDLGRSLRPERSPDSAAHDTGDNRRTRIDDIERARLLGAVLPPDDYGDWMSGAGAFKRAMPKDPDGAFQCYSAWSACSSKYQGPEDTRRKFDQVPADYDGPALPVTLGILHWRARRRAEAVIATLYQPVWPGPVGLHKPADNESVTCTGNQPAPVPPGGAAGPVDPGSPSPEDGIVAVDYLAFCWKDEVLQNLARLHAIPPDVLAEAKRRGDERRERIDLAGRTLHRWGGKDLAEDTKALCAAIINSGAPLFRIDNTLVRISAPASDRMTAARMRSLHGYAGRPGDPGDPALNAGERIVPLLPSDLEALRELIASDIATKRRVNRGTKSAPDWQEEIASFGFKSTARIHAEPDAGVLKDLAKRALVAEVPEIRGVITAPVIPDLPRSTRAEDVTKAGADRLVVAAGFDPASGLYLSPLGTIAAVPDVPSAIQVRQAADLLVTPWADFPFVSPGADLEAEISRSACVYSLMVAANRRALEIAPGIAFSSHGEGMSSGKTLAGEVICAVATGTIPAPVSLSPDFTEQRKEIITHLLEGDGCLFLDNIPTGSRFDVAPLASSMTSDTFKGRLLGANKQIEVCTRVMIVATGNSLNMAGDLASRFLLVRLDTGLERPEDRSVEGFAIPDLRQWVIEHRQQLVAAVHTIVRAYLQECRRQDGTPAEVIARRAVSGTRFGGPCEVLRDALLWAFPSLPDPFLSFQASAATSSTKSEAEFVLNVLDHALARAAGEKCAPPWTKSAWHYVQSPERTRWELKFGAKWARMAVADRQRRYQTALLNDAEDRQWRRLQARVRTTIGRAELRAGRVRFTAAEIISALSMDEKQTIEGALHGRGALNPVALGRWLKDRLVDAPLCGLRLCSAPDREKRTRYWITKGGVK